MSLFQALASLVPRSLVARLDFLTSLGHGRSGRERDTLGMKTKGPTHVVTDLCIMRPDPATREFVVVSLHPGVTRNRVQQNTGWAVRFAEAVEGTRPPTALELETLRELNTRSARAHGTTSV